MSKKLDKEFKEEFDNELREATYATRKIGTKIIAGIAILAVLGGSRASGLYKNDWQSSNKRRKRSV